MKFFGKNRPLHKSQLSGLAREYFIGSGVFISGDLTSENDIYLDGTYEGNISSGGLVEIDVNAKMSGSCHARTVQIKGRFEGEIIAQENTSISSSAHIIGSIKTRTLETQPGAIIDAKISAGSS